MEFGVISVSISEAALEIAVTENMGVGGAVEKSNDQTVKLSVVTALIEFRMFEMELGSFLI